MNSSTTYSHPHSMLRRFIVGAVVPLLLIGCQDRVFTEPDVDHPSDGQQTVRITATVLDPVSPSGTRAVPGDADDDQVVPGVPDDFGNLAADGSEFESQIATLRVIGFYKEAQGEHKAGDVAFNHLYADWGIINDLNWSRRADAVGKAVKDLTVAAKPDGATKGEKGVAVQFETKLSGEFDLVLIANESLKAVATPGANVVDTGEIYTLMDNENDDGDRHAFDLSTLETLQQLRETYMTTTWYIVFHDDGTYGDKNLSSHLSHYHGALPASCWNMVCGGLPMVGETTLSIHRSAASPTGEDIKIANLNLERMVAKIEVRISNTTDKEDRVIPEILERRLVSIRLNNHPLYAMVLPAAHSDSLTYDFATRGTNFHLYSDPKSRFMDMYRAEEKVFGWGARNWGVLPLRPTWYDHPENRDKGQNGVWKVGLS